MTAPVEHRGWYHGWTIVSVCVLSQVATNGLPISAFSLFLHDWSVLLNAPNSKLQLGLALCGLGSALFSPVAGALADKFKSRTLIVIGLLVLALICLGMSFVTSFGQYLVLYALLPISLLLSTSLTANAVVSRWFVRRLGLALGLTAFGLGLGGVIMPPLIAAVLPVIGWRAVWRIGGIFVAVVVVPVVLLVVRERPSARDGTFYLTSDGTPPTPLPHGRGKGGALGWRDILGRRNFWILVVVYVPMLAMYGGCLQNMTPIALSRGLGQQAAGYLLSLASVATLGGTLAAGLLSDRFGNRAPLIAFSLITATGGVVLALGHSVPALGVGALFAGLGNAYWPLLAAACAKEFGTEGFGRAFGMLAFFVTIAIISPLGIARSEELTGSYKPAFLFVAACCVVGAAACLLLRERRAPPAAPVFA